MNRAATFIDDEDCVAYLQALAFASSEHGVEIHAYVLMGNHVQALGNDSASRATAYRALLLEPLAGDQLSSIRDHMRQERALGNPSFQAMVEKTLNRPAQLRVAGRPRREHTDSIGNVLTPIPGWIA